MKKVMSIVLVLLVILNLSVFAEESVLPLGEGPCSVNGIHYFRMIGGATIKSLDGSTTRANGWSIYRCNYCNEYFSCSGIPHSEYEESIGNYIDIPLSSNVHNVFGTNYYIFSNSPIYYTSASTLTGFMFVSARQAE